jgi:membrane peptidoglycan carboxypeptidase
VLENLTGLSKDRLLEIYLNIIEWGPGVHGAAEAARFYFDKEPIELSLDESLFLTVLVPSPSRWRSRVDADGALRPWARQQMAFIARKMATRGVLDSAAVPAAESLRVELRGPAAADLLARRLAAAGGAAVRPAP